MTTTLKEFATANQGFSLISNRKLLALYQAMVECRRQAADPGSHAGRRRGPAAGSIVGHEAAVVGAAIDLAAHDSVSAPGWPDAALKAVNPLPSLAQGPAVAARDALANQDCGKIAVLFSSGKRDSQAAWIKTLSLAAEHNLPILFVALDVTGSSATPPIDGSIHVKRRGYTFPVINVDGNDVVAVYRVASESIAHARKGHGPTLIDCRLSLPGNPIENMQKYMIGKGLDPEELAAWDASPPISASPAETPAPLLQSASVPQ